MEEYFWRLGHDFTGHKLNLGADLGLRRYKAFFGVPPIICAKLWNLLNGKCPKGSCPTHLLWSVVFLKQYNSENVNHVLLGADEKMIRKWTWCFIKLLSELEIIKWDSRFENAALGQTCFVSLDGVDFRILEPKPFSPKWYSHKFRSAGLRYEVGLCIRTGKIVWHNGGFPCGTYPDLKLAYQAYILMTNENELTLADKGYKNSKYFILPNDKNNAKHKQIMSRHETVNKRLRQFKVLYVPFRHSITKHKLCFEAVVNITELLLENGSPLFAVGD